MKRTVPLGFALPVLVAGALGLGACSLALDFGGTPDDDLRPDARARDAAYVDATPEPPMADGAPQPDANTIDATPLCRTEGGGPDVLDPMTGNCFIFLEGFGRPYLTARGECEALGARLASLATRREFDLVLARMVAAGYWLGLDDLGTEGTFVWSSAETGTFTNWRLDEPNDAMGLEDCTVMYGNYVGEFAAFVGGWNDVDCTTTRYAVCERTPP